MWSGMIIFVTIVDSESVSVGLPSHLQLQLPMMYPPPLLDKHPTPEEFPPKEYVQVHIIFIYLNSVMHGSHIVMVAGEI